MQLVIVGKYNSSLWSGVSFPSKYARSDPEAFWLWPIMAIMASVRPKLGQLVYAGSDFPHLFRLCSSKEGMDHIVQN